VAALLPECVCGRNGVSACESVRVCVNQRYNQCAIVCVDEQQDLGVAHPQADQFPSHWPYNICSALLLALFVWQKMPRNHNDNHHTSSKYQRELDEKHIIPIIIGLNKEPFMPVMIEILLKADGRQSI